MKTLKQSVRRSLKGLSRYCKNYNYQGESGCTSKRGTLYGVFIDVNDNELIEGEYRIYAHGDGMKERDYRGMSCNITEPVVEYMRGYISWHDVINDVENIVLDKLNK